MTSGGCAPASGGGRSTPRGPAGVTPLYKRLPSGPHRLDPLQVALHQRARIHGAMVEAVARSGYGGASVKQVIGLAGVSRRSFYELFANKQECFMATFDLLAEREIEQLRRAYLAADGGLEPRLSAVFASCAQSADRERNAALLVLVDVQTAGAGRHAAALPCGRRMRADALAQCFLQSRGVDALPAPVLRGIVGGLHGALAARLRRGPLEEGGGLPDELLEWTLAFGIPAGGDTAERFSERLRDRVRQVSCASARRPPSAPPRPRDERARLLHSMLRLAAGQDHSLLSAPQIADGAGVSIDAFFDLFESKDDCLQAALRMSGRAASVDRCSLRPDRRRLAAVDPPGDRGPALPSCRQSPAGPSARP